MGFGESGACLEGVCVSVRSRRAGKEARRETCWKMQGWKRLVDTVTGGLWRAGEIMRAGR